METLLDLKFDLAHNKIIVGSPPSLKQLTSVRVAVNLWYEEEIDKWDVEELQTQVQGKVPPLTIPETLKGNIALMSELVGDQLDKFTTSLEEILNFPAKWRILQNRIHWTSQGTIDMKSTAESFADCEVVDIVTRFKIAVEFYLNDRLDALYDDLPLSYIKNLKGMDFPSLCVMFGHDIVSKLPRQLRARFPPDFRKRFKLILEESNKVVCHFYWQLLGDNIKRIILQEFSEVYYKQPDIFVFLFTQFEQEEKVRLLSNDSHFVFRLLDALLDLRWFSILDGCISKMSKCLKTPEILCLLCTCAMKLESSLAYKNKYVPICAMLIQLHRNRTSTHNYSYDTTDWNFLLAIAMSFLASEKMAFLEELLESMSAENRKKLLSHSDIPSLMMLFASSLKFKTIVALRFLFPSLEDRQKFLTDSRFIAIVSLYIEKEWISALNGIFCLLFLDFGDVESYKRQFAKKNGSFLCRKFVANGQPECIDKLFHWIFSPQ